ncbi:Hvo_1808 family surface protein [Halarchaeum salinum]|uniref:Hvo_1808 family surface protein n=1 Tax=Halarchaeum salinum TaxID=489912 RepID=A0AAV3S3H0_9EURY
MRTRFRTLFLVVLLVASSAATASAATVGATTADASSVERAEASAAPIPAQAAETAEPNRSIGYVDGYAYDASIRVDQSDGLSDAEIYAYVRRTMARVERLRGHDFEDPVPVHVMSRAAYRANQSSGSVNTTYSRWNQQVWRAALIVGSNTNLSAAMSSYYSNSVQGFYSPSDDAIEIIVPSGKQAYIDRSTLAHELTHALQDQYYDLSDPMYGGETQDTQLATSALVEGEARYVQNRYSERCTNGTWQCVATPSSSSESSSASSPSPPASLQYTLYFPYASGPGYVHELIERGGWDAVDAAWRHPPATTTEIIHGEAPSAANVSVDRDAATNGWRTFSGVGANGTGTDTLGEASIFMGLWWQSARYDAGVVPTDISVDDGYRTIRYAAPASTGWADGVVLPYRNGDANGFVWKTAWETSADASDFASGYVAALKAHGATRKNGTWVVSTQDGYQGAYRVVQANETVTIVNGPDVAAVTDIRPSLAETENTAGTSAGSSPGFGFPVAVGAFALAVVFLLRRR